MPIIVTYSDARTPYTEWLRDVIPECPGLDNVFAAHIIRQAAIEFCTRTWVYQYDATGAMVAATSQYDLTLPASTEVTGSIFVKAQSELTGDEKGLGKATRTNISLAATEDDGPPRYYTKPLVSSILFFPAPDAAYTFTNRLALRPTADSTDIDTDVYSRYRMPIAHGAMFKLQAMANKPWSSPSTATYHGTEYVRAIREARIELEKEFTGENLQVDLSLGAF